MLQLNCIDSQGYHGRLLCGHVYAEMETSIKNKPGGVTQQSNIQLLSAAFSEVAFCIPSCMLWDMGSN